MEWKGEAAAFLFLCRVGVVSLHCVARQAVKARGAASLKAAKFGSLLRLPRHGRPPRRRRGAGSAASGARAVSSACLRLCPGILETYEAKWLLHAEPRQAHSTGANESKIAREVSVHCTDDAAAAWNGSPPGPGGGNRAKRRSPPRWRARGPPLPPRRGGSFCPDCSKGRPSALAKRRHTLLVLGKGVRWQVWSSCRWTKPRFPTATVPKIRRFQFPTPCPKPHVLELRMRRAWGSTPPPQSCSLFPPNSTTTNLLAVLLSRHHRPRRPLPAVP